MIIAPTNLDLAQLTKDAGKCSAKIVKNFSHLIDSKITSKSYQATLDQQLSQAPITSKLHDHYNLFTFPYVGITEVCKEAIRVFKEVNLYDDQYYVHAWLNYQHKGESIPFHHHWKGLSGLDNTYVATCYINAEPSVTTYKYKDGSVYDHHCKNNTISIFEDLGDIHQVSAWEGDEPRISISMDFVPMKYIRFTPYIPNTWMPVL